MHILDPVIEYPFRASLIKIARCGMCENTIREDHGRDGDLVIECTMGLELIYPLITGEHKCKLYKYKPIPQVKVPKNKLKTFVGLIDQLKECKQCSHNLQGYCDGIKWFPFETDPKCEFFRAKNLICKYAIPYFQYGSTMRNNYCQLEPEKRAGDNKRGWKWNCPNAHEKSAEYYKCYNPKGVEK